MKVTELQVQRSLEALAMSAPRLSDLSPFFPIGPIDAVPAGPAGFGPERSDPRCAGVPAGLVAQLNRSSPVRLERVEAARRRFERGDTPTDQALADRMVGRLVCDRLR